ncbi:hypothetical protein [Streptomyces sp. NBC_00005]|uniref:hypothetical protein n=1 Tax=Streptomyces sp. NBC_00005 TaxID=2903609 RepID=UPI0032493E5D
MAHRETHTGTLLGAAGTALVAAVPVAAWGLMGQQDAEGLSASELDHAFQPWAVADGTAAAIGATALLVAAVGVTLLARATLRGALDRRWWQVLGPLTLAGLVVGVGWRIMTAGVVGANIGAGLTLMFGGPVVAGLVLWALFRGVWLATRGTGHGGRGQQLGFAPRGA